MNDSRKQAKDRSESITVKLCSIIALFHFACVGGLLFKQCLCIRMCSHVCLSLLKVFRH